MKHETTFCFNGWRLSLSFPAPTQPPAHGPGELGLPALRLQFPKSSPPAWQSEGSGQCWLVLDPWHPGECLALRRETRKGYSSHIVNTNWAFGIRLFEFDHCFRDVSPYTLICGRGRITLLSGSWFDKIVYVNYLGSGTEQELSKWKLLAFLRVLLRSNWWRLSFTYLKCTFWWVLIYIYGCTTIAMIKIKISTPSHVCSSSLGIQPSLLSKKKKKFPSQATSHILFVNVD